MEAINRMKDKVDTLIVVANDQLLQIVPENTPLTGENMHTLYTYTKHIQHTTYNIHIQHTHTTYTKHYTLLHYYTIPIYDIRYTIYDIP
jgi:hypothetical protein